MERSSGAQRRETDERRRAVFHDAAAIVQAEYGVPLQLEEVARRIGTSARQLRRAFADVAGTGFRAYLTTVRMTHAADLLRSTALPVAEVADRVGYKDPSRFAKAFRREYGVSPSEFRGR